MRILKRMLLHHWYTYDNDLMEFDDINFLTGDTGSGKSTIIDALQLILLGDSSGTFFNKAANEKSARTLRGYLFGEIGDDGEAGFRYLRNGRFTSYVVLEFENTVRHENFVTGYVADCHSDQTWDSQWFILRKNGIPENHFLSEDSVPMDIPLLRRTLRSTYGTNCVNFYETNRSFQEALLGIYGQVKRKYFYLFKKAVPFTPITNIEQFITESVCDVSNNIDINNMQSDIRQYNELEKEARSTKQRIEALQQIDDDQAKLEDTLEKRKQQEYVVIRAEQDEKAESFRELQEKVQLLDHNIQKNKEQERELQKQEDKLTAEYDKLREEYATSDVQIKARQLQSEMDRHSQQIQDLQSRISRVVNALHTYGKEWRELAEDFQLEGDECLAQMEQISEEATVEFDFQLAAETMHGLQVKLYEMQTQCKTRAMELKEQRTQLQDEIANLEKGIKPYPENVRRLQQMLDDYFHGSVEVNILADLLEIKDPSWRNAIEGYLDKQKFYILVPPRYYREALKVYDEMRSKKPVYDAGLVDIGKLKKERGNCRVERGSLAEEISTEDPDARLYTDYILGRVMKCDRAEDLNHYRTAITRDAMLYKNYVARRLNPARYRNPFIGRSSLKRLLELRRTQLADVQEGLDTCYRELMRYGQAAHTAAMSLQEAQSYAQTMQKRSKLLQLCAEKKKLETEFEALDFTWLNRIKEQMEQLQKEIRQKESTRSGVHDEATRMEENIRNLQQNVLPEAEKQLESVKEEIAAQYSTEWISSVGEPRFLKEKEPGKRKTMTLKDSFSRMVTQSTNQAEEFRKKRNEDRRNYNNTYMLSYDSESEDNEEYHQEFVKLSEIQLPKYMDQIQDSKQKAYNQFRDDFIAKLKENIETVRQQIDELNKALRNYSFGRDKYQFHISPRAEYKSYYEMIMDPLLINTGGWNLASDAFNKKYQKEIDSLFQMLILEDQVSAEEQKEYEKNIQKYTNYRTYLTFDLVVTNDQGERQRLSKMLSKKSGGETQLPFYISMLASFSQTCRINTKKDDTIRLIVLDEAFSKMDSERIRESIRLLRQMGLQAIFSAPSEKVGDIAPYADRTIVAFRMPQEHKSFTKYYCSEEILNRDGNEG